MDMLDYNMTNKEDEQRQTHALLQVSGEKKMSQLTRFVSVLFMFIKTEMGPTWPRLKDLNLITISSVESPLTQPAATCPERGPSALSRLEISNGLECSRMF